MSYSTFWLLLLCLLSLAIAAPTNATLVARKDFEPGDTLARTMCFCTNDNNFTQSNKDPYSFDFAPQDHQVAIVYKFEYYNHRIDHHFALHALDNCRTRPNPHPYDPKDSNDPDPTTHHGILLNPCLDWQAQRSKDWCHTFHTPQVPKGVHLHQWEYCYQFHGDTFHDEKHRDFWTFYKDRRGLPRKPDWRANEAEVRDRCTEVCHAKWDMKMLEDEMGAVFSRVDQFHKFDDICYHGSEANQMDCDMPGGGG